MWHRLKSVESRMKNKGPKLLLATIYKLKCFDLKGSRVRFLCGLVIWAFLLPIVGIANAQNLVVPKGIYRYVISQGCDQVDDFFTIRSDVESGPFVRKFVFLKDNFAVWCTSELSKKDQLRKYSLLVHIDDNENPLSKCQDRIDGIDFIGGLSFEEIDEPADSFYFLDKRGADSREKVSITGRLKTVAIKSNWDGTGAYYVCVLERWAKQSFH